MHALRELGGDVPVSLGQQITFCESKLASALQIAQSLGDRASEADLLSRLALSRPIACTSTRLSISACAR